MKIYSWNVNGIRAAMKKGLTGWLASTLPDIFCLQEVRAEEDQIPEELRNVTGYTAFWNPAQRKGYSGTGIMTRIAPEEINLGWGDPEFDNEGRIVQLVFRDWVLNSVYFPNGANGDDRLDYKLRFYDAFLENSDAWVRKGKHVVTLGDYNTCHKEIDIARPKENEGVSGFLPIERAWMDKYVEHGYVDTFRLLHMDARDVYSWWSNRGGARSRNVGWRIDYCFVDQGLVPMVRSALIHPEVMGSDHCPISVELDLPE
ncbi:MAG TPA: exodeoxyribonuclease III [Fibrobacteraceae bacterium]|nr:exodeoxyribonuclease III [Fibrobacteraceae bacterium]